MSVTARPTPGLRRRLRRGGHPADDFQVTDRRPAAAPVFADPAALRAPADPPQDEATYSCACGYVFAATVTTSVACPYCGDAQAW